MQFAVDEVNKMTPLQVEKFKKKFQSKLFSFLNTNSTIPKCSNDGCEKPRMWQGGYKNDGSKVYKKLCASCNTAKWINKYVQHKKDFCENIDGRLGYKCTTKLMFSGQLQVDHVDGNPYNNIPRNLQTLCACCHIYKTNIMGDSKTPGRKTLLN